MKVLQRQASVLQGQVNTETRQLTRLQNIVNSECNGNSGNGLTGVVGDGPACQKDQQDVTRYSASHPIAAQNRQLAGLLAQIRTLQGGLSGQQARYRTAVSAAITRRLQRETPPSAPIGMAERFQALTYLSLSSALIGVASWFVRIFFILIDCLPVLVKFISGSTPYDRLVDTETSSAERQFSRVSDTQDAVADEENETVLQKARAEAAHRRKEIDLEILRQDAERGTFKEDAVDELWRKKLHARRSARAGARSGSWSPGSSWSGHDDTGPHMNGSSGYTGEAADQVPE